MKFTPEKPALFGETLDSLTLEDPDDPLELLRYWSDQGVERTAFLRRVLQRLDERPGHCAP